jgi:predicted O-methyltransferase YrrM
VYSKLTHAKKWWHYYRTASSGIGHGIHSPFIFEFIKNVLNDKREFYAYTPTEHFREKLKNDHTTIKVNDLGAGSRIAKNNQRLVSEIAKHSLKSKKLAQLLFRMVNYYQPKNIIELGTSLGLTTAYLASANGKGNVYTIEGIPEIAAIARMNFQQLNLYNFKLLEGGFDSVLPLILEEMRQVDFAFIDGNHRLEPTVRYFEWILKHTTPDSILIFDDIHWSEEMEQAWKTIRDHTAVTCTVDLFFLGVVFLRNDFKAKQHFTIRF